MKRIVIFMLIYTFFSIAAMAHGQPYLVAEPPLAEQTAWNVAANGMVFVSYDTNHNGKADFRTFHTVAKTCFSKQSPAEVEQLYPDYQVFTENREPVNFYYLAVRYPLFYVIDVNEDGIWDLVYKDADQDGVNGNEKLTGSPSKMFAGKVYNF